MSQHKYFSIFLVNVIFYCPMLLRYLMLISSFIYTCLKKKVLGAYSCHKNFQEIHSNMLMDTIHCVHCAEYFQYAVILHWHLCCDLSIYFHDLFLLFILLIYFYYWSGVSHSELLLPFDL